MTTAVADPPTAAAEAPVPVPEVPGYDQTARLLAGMFDPLEYVLVRFIEIWKETHNGKEKKRSRTVFKKSGCWRREFVTPQTFRFFLNTSAAEKANVFFGVCPRLRPIGFDRAWQIRKVVCVWADIDNCTPEQAVERCHAAGLPHPSAIVSSGNGTHLYWFLATPYDIDDVGDPPEVKREFVVLGGKKKCIQFFLDEHGDRVNLNSLKTGDSIPSANPDVSPKGLFIQDVVKGIAAKIGGDHTIDLSRLLRLPGTQNMKDARNGRPSIPCELIELGGERYDIEVFRRFVDESPDKKEREKIAGVPLPTIRKVSAARRDTLNRKILVCATAEDRSAADWNLCCFAIEKGVAADELWPMVASVGKFAERGRAYFDYTWNRAAKQTQQRIFSEATGKKSAVPQTATIDAEPAGESPDDSAADGADSVCPTDLLDNEQQTELAASRRLLKRYGFLLRYVPAWRTFLQWSGFCWEMDHCEIQAMTFAKKIADEIWDEVKQFPTDDAVDFAQKMAKHSGLRAMVNTVASDIAIDHRLIDRDPMLFNCLSHTIDLRTGEARPHSPDDHLMKCAPVEFDKEAACPTWLKFLEGVFVSAAIVAFIKRLLGYALTGMTVEQILVIFFGVGSNGKTTLLTTLQLILGDYASQAPPGLLIQKKNQQHPTELADLFGRRFVVATESGVGCRLDENLVKQLTGSDIIKGRRMHENFWEFNPTHKLVLCTNHRPVIRGTDWGIWRRVMLVPFTRIFEGRTKDKTMPQKLAKEASGILNWLIEGCLEWQRDGLNPPDEVTTATREYRDEQDILGRFVSTCCEVGNSQFKVRFSMLYERLEAWCNDGGDNLPSRKAVGNWLKEQGYKERHSGGRWYDGIRLPLQESD